MLFDALGSGMLGVSTASPVSGTASCLSQALFTSPEQDCWLAEMVYLMYVFVFCLCTVMLTDYTSSLATLESGLVWSNTTRNQLPVYSLDWQ